MRPYSSKVLDGSPKAEVPTHVLFDFFGTLVNYDSSHLSERGHEQSFDLLRDAGSPLDYKQFITLWPKLFAEFDQAAEQSHQEFSLIELASTFLRRTMGEPAPTLVRDFARTYVSEWNQGVKYLEGLSEMIERLHHRFTLAIITNTHDPSLGCPTT